MTSTQSYVYATQIFTIIFNAIAYRMLFFIVSL